MAVADINGDGKPDPLLATPCPSSICGINPNPDSLVAVLLGNGDGSFQSAVTYDSLDNDATSIAVTDLNGDGKPDVVVVNDCPYCATGALSVLLGNGDGTLQPAARYDSGGRQPFSVAITDVNGDGNTDLVVANCAANTTCFSNIPGSVGVLTGNGEGPFSQLCSLAPERIPHSPLL